MIDAKGALLDRENLFFVSVDDSFGFSFALTSDDDLRGRYSLAHDPERLAARNVSQSTAKV